MKQYRTFIFLILTLASASVTLSQKQADSISVANYFEKIQFETNSDSINLQIESFKRNVNKSDLDQYYYHYAKYLLLHSDIEKAKINANIGLKSLGKDTIGYKSIKLLNLVAAAYSMQKEYVKAIKYFNRSIKISEEINNKTQSAYLQNNVANIFFSIQDYESAYEYSLKAYNNIKTAKEDPYRIQILSVLSVAEAKVGKTASAKKHALSALKEANEMNDSLSLIVAHYSLGDIALSHSELINAKIYFSKSLDVSEKLNNYTYIMLNSIGLMTTCLSLKEYEEAVQHGEKGLAIAIALQNDNTLYSLKRNLATAYFETGKPDKAFKLLNEAHKIYKESTNAERQEAINDILIKYDTEKKEKELATKNILLLEKDIKASRFFQIILSLGFVLILLIIYFFFHRQKMKQRALQQSIQYEKNKLMALISGEEEERTRIANELHDGLASSITAVRYKLESFDTNPTDEKVEIISLLKQIHEDTRRIAHNLSPLMLETYGLFKSIDYFATENQSSTSKIQVYLTGNDSEVHKNTALIIYRFTQELVQNAIKYSDASIISINLVCSSERIDLMVEDNGNGFDLKTTNLKGGLLSVTSRVQSLHGTIEIDSTLKQGTVIHISLPITL